MSVAAGSDGSIPSSHDVGVVEHDRFVRMALICDRVLRERIQARR